MGSVTRMYRITPSIGCCVTGRLPDARALLFKSRQIAAEFQFDNGYQIPVRHLANEVANYNQIFTQHAYKRVPGVSLLYCAIDDEVGPRLYMVDPAGSCYGFAAIHGLGTVCLARTTFKLTRCDRLACLDEGPHTEALKPVEQGAAFSMFCQFLFAAEWPAFFRCWLR